MSYTPFYGTGWADEPTETTPIVAAALNHADAGITAAAAAADAASAALPGKVDRAGDVMTGRLAPRVIALTDAATIAVDASAGNDFRVTLAGNRTLGPPSGGADGQVIHVAVTQDATGGRTLAFDAAYKFGLAGAPVVTAAAAAADVLAFKLYGGGWRYLGAAAGF